MIGDRQDILSKTHRHTNTDGCTQTYTDTHTDTETERENREKMRQLKGAT